MGYFFVSTRLVMLTSGNDNHENQTVPFHLHLEKRYLWGFFTQGAWIYRGYTRVDRTFPQETRTLRFLGQCMLVFHC